MNNKPVLTGLCFAELKGLLSSYPPFRSRQIYKWILAGTKSFNDMTNLPFPLRKELEEKFTLCSGTVGSELHDPDGTIKLGITLDDSSIIEAVILQDAAKRTTACLSTQAGCPLGCVFCKTGKLGFKRNLSASEISAQFMHLRMREPDISHIVIMGMGEPLLNLEELRKALNFFMDPDGLNISKRRITVSTSGIEKGILDLAENGPDIRLAFSITTARPLLREKLMPGSRENPLPLLKKALREYQKKRDRRITLEMVILGGINSSLPDAEAASDFAKGLNTVINLIPWNFVEGQEFEGAPLKAPTIRELEEFRAALESRGLKVTQRYGRGKSISGACGQLGVVIN